MEPYKWNDHILDNGINPLYGPLVMWRCERCGEVFEEPDYDSICAEDYYGVSSLFGNSNYIEYAVCPECGSEELEENYYGEEEEDEL